MEFYSGQPENPAASVRDYCTGVLNIVSWDDFYEKIGDVFFAVASDIRHVEPDGDSNRSRWKNSKVWETVGLQLTENLFEVSCGASPDKIKEVKRPSWWEHALSRRFSHHLIYPSRWPFLEIGTGQKSDTFVGLRQPVKLP